MERNELICRMAADILAGYMGSQYRGIVLNMNSEEYITVFDNSIRTAEKIVKEVYDRHP